MGNGVTPAAEGDRPLRIAICLAHFHPTVGGAERQMQQLAERWARWGHQPLVFTRRVAGLPRHETLRGVEIHRVIRTCPVGPLFGLSFISSLAANLIRFSRRYDVVLDGQVPWEAVATGLVCPALGKPVVVVPASTGPAGDVRQIVRAKGAWCWRRLVRKNTVFLALSSQAAEELRELGCPEAAIRPITNGVDLERFVPGGGDADERGRTVLYLSRLAAAKNPHVLLRAWRRLNGDGRYRLLIAGDGPLAGELRQAAARDDLRNVEFVGQVEDVPAAHRRASVFVLPSPSEGCSNALLEAMASGLCPVVTRVPGNLDIVRDGQNGQFFDHDDDAQLAATLARVLDDPALRERLSAAARQHILEHHDLDQIARRFLSLFRELLGPRRGALVVSRS